jgi:uncharacterized protein
VRFAHRRTRRKIFIASPICGARQLFYALTLPRLERRSIFQNSECEDCERSEQPLGRGGRHIFIPFFLINYMHWHMVLTEVCNSNCKYCYEKSMKEENDLNERFKFDYSAPHESRVEISKLKKFLEKDKNPWIEFYGGEPLLQLEKMREIMKSINAKFVVQTNGKLLDKLTKEDLKKFEKILVSIDGDEERTDENRGAGTYSKVVENIRLIRKKGFRGEIVARMAVSFPDIFEQVKHLISLSLDGVDSIKESECAAIACQKSLRSFGSKFVEVRSAHGNASSSLRSPAARPKQIDNSVIKKIFDSVHWQLDAGFYKHDYNKKKFEKFVKEYNAEISKLIEFWIGEMKRGRVIKLYPFLAIVESLLKNEPTKLRCGSGYANYTITTDGKLAVCPIMSCWTDFYCGDLDSDLTELKKFYVSGVCDSCSYLDLCGGRCFYANKAKLWPVEGQELICKTVEYLIDSLRARIGEINELIGSGKISLKDFEYEKYFGPEIIP